MGDVGKTITGGIQDISALLPLLGTEQCETHLGSALSEGYLYAAAAPMSIFGSLGLVKAGVKALLASVSIQRFRFLGARKVEHAGFTPAGKSLALIMMDPEETGIHLAERKFDILCQEYHIEHAAEKLRIKADWAVWNLRLIAMTTVFCLCGMAPYIHLAIGGPGSRPSLPTRWTFPALRVFGGWLIAVATQILVQRRLVRILECRLAFHRLDPVVSASITNPKDSIGWHAGIPAEECLWNLHSYLGRKKALPTSARNNESRDVEKGVHNIAHVPEEQLRASLQKTFTQPNDSSEDLIFLMLVSVGICCSLVGYVGCFSVVQGARNSRDPIIWLALEALLSIIRIIIWSWNPSFDDCDPIRILFSTEADQPLISCYRTESKIERDASFRLPLTDSRQFFTSLTNYAGLLPRFDSPSVSLFYTLARRIPSWPNHTPLTERLLYITIFDRNKPGTCRVFFEDIDGLPQLYDATPLSESLDGVLTTVAVGARIEPSSDMIMSNPIIFASIQQHHRSLTQRLRSREGQSGVNGGTMEFTWILNSRKSKITLPSLDPPQLASSKEQSPSSKDLVSRLRLPINPSPDGDPSTDGAADLMAVIYLAVQTEVILLEELAVFANNPTPLRIDKEIWAQRVQRDGEAEVAFAWRNIQACRQQINEKLSEIERKAPPEKKSLQIMVSKLLKRLPVDLDILWEMLLDQYFTPMHDTEGRTSAFKTQKNRLVDSLMLPDNWSAASGQGRDLKVHLRVQSGCSHLLQLQNLNMKLRTAQRCEEGSVAHLPSFACSSTLHDLYQSLFIHMPMSDDPDYVNAVKGILFGGNAYLGVKHVVFCQHIGWVDGDDGCAELIRCLDRFPALVKIDFGFHGVGDETFKAIADLRRRVIRTRGVELQVVGINVR